MSMSRWTLRWRPGGPGVGWRSRGPRQQCAQAYQVVGRRGEGHDPIDETASTMPQLPQPADRLHPTKDLFNQLPFLLADQVAGVSRGAAVDGAAFDLLRDVRRDAQGSHARDEAGDVEALVAPDGAARWRARVEQHVRRVPFGRAGGGRRADVRHQPVSIVQEDM